LIYPGGSKFVGDNKEGGRWNGTDYDKYGNLWKIVNEKGTKQTPPKNTTKSKITTISKIPLFYNLSLYIYPKIFIQKT